MSADRVFRTEESAHEFLIHDGHARRGRVVHFRKRSTAEAWNARDLKVVGGDDEVERAGTLIGWQLRLPFDLERDARCACSRQVGTRRCSLRTEQAYLDWIRRFILFHGKRHPNEMGEKEVTAFLTHLAADRRVAASTQNQALSALLFLYQQVLERKLDFIDNVERVKRPAKLPVVFTPTEARAVLAHLKGDYRLMAELL